MRKNRSEANAKSKRHPAFRSVDRRLAAIGEALLQSMSEKGFAATTLTDVAKRAGMSPSHLLYYYPDKESVLVDLTKSVNDGTLNFMAGLESKPPEVQCRELVEYFFDGRNVPPNHRAVMLELMAVGIHDPELLRRMREQTARFTTFLRQIYRKASATAVMPAEDAATLAAAVWMGLHVNSLVDDTLSMERAGRLMLTALALLGGFEASPSEKESPAQSVQAARRKQRA